MGEVDKIGSIVRLRRFSPVIDLQWAEKPGDESGLGLIGSYIVTGELANYFENILESLTLKRHVKKISYQGEIPDPSINPRAHMLRGQYGTGKSYFLLMISAFIEALADERLFTEIYDKFRAFEGIRFQLDELRKASAKYLVVRIDGVKNIDMRFHELVQKSTMDRIRKVFGEDSFSDSYTRAAAKLEEYRLDPVFSGLLAENLGRRGIEYDALLNGIKESKRKSLNIYRQLMEDITRHKLDEGFDSLEAFLRSASDYVKSKAYTGIVILIDEFSAYVKNSIEDGRITADLAAIQSLAQLTAPREGQDLFFVCSMHVDFLSILGGETEAAEEIRKVRGRFSEMTLTFSNSQNLVENILMVDGEGFRDFYDKYRRYFGALLNRYPDMGRVYPIHPHTVKSIIKVSSKYAQNERTIFSFFAQAVNRKLNEPVIKEDRLNLINTGDIYDYFIESISERNLLLKESALRCLSFCRNPLERDIVKALIIAQVSADENSDARLSSTDIAFIIGVDDIRSIDTFLKEMNTNPASNVLFYENHNRFEFIASGNMMSDISLMLDNEMEKTDSYEALLSALNEYSGRVCIRKIYVVNPSRETLPVRKDMEGVVYRPDDLLNSLDAEAQSIEKDGKLLFVVPGFTDATEAEFLKTIKERLRSAPSNICVAVPKMFPVHIERDLKLHSAAVSILKTGKLDENGVKMLQKIHSPVERNIENEIRKFASTQNLMFVFNNETVCDGFLCIEELFGFMLGRHFNKFPRVNAEAIRGKNSVHILVENFLAGGGKTNIPEKYGTELEKMIMDVMRPLDLVKVERSGSGYSARLKIPEEKNNRESLEIWEIVNDTSRTVMEIFSLLQKAPYGIPDYLVELYIASAVAANQLSIVYRGQSMQLNKMSISFVNTPGYSLEKVRTASSELKYEVKKVWMVFSRIHSRCAARNFDPGIAQSDSAIRTLLATDIADVKAILSGFETRLENTGIMNGALPGLIKSVVEAGAVSNPVDCMEEFTKLPAKVFPAENDNVAALQRFDGFFAFLADLNAGLDGIWKVESVLGTMRSLEEENNEYTELRTLYFEVRGMLENVKKYIEDNEYPSQLVTEIKSRLGKLIMLYNEAFMQLHEKVSKETKELLSMLEGPSAELIEAFERIKFKDIKTMSDIRSQLRGIRACSLHPGMREDEPVSCTCIGFRDGLSELVSQLQGANHMKESIGRQIRNIGGIHVSRLLELDSGGRMGEQQEKPATGSGCVGEQQAEYAAGQGCMGEQQIEPATRPGCMGRSAPFLDDASARPEIIKAWNSLKEYLSEGFEEIADRSFEDAISLVKTLAPYINAYLTAQEADHKKEEVKIKEKRKIGYKVLYNQIHSEIINMGYKSITVDDFSNKLQRIIDRLKKEYDEVDLDDNIIKHESGQNYH